MTIIANKESIVLTHESIVDKSYTAKVAVRGNTEALGLAHEARRDSLGALPVLAVRFARN